MNESIDLMKRIVANTMIKEKTNYKFVWFVTRVNFCFCNAAVIPMLNNGMGKKGLFLKVEKEEKKKKQSKTEFSRRSLQKEAVTGIKEKQSGKCSLVSWIQMYFQVGPYP